MFHTNFCCVFVRLANGENHIGASLFLWLGIVYNLSMRYCNNEGSLEPLSLLISILFC